MKLIELEIGRPELFLEENRKVLTPYWQKIYKIYEFYNRKFIKKRPYYIWIVTVSFAQGPKNKKE